MSIDRTQRPRSIQNSKRDGTTRAVVHCNPLTEDRGRQWLDLGDDSGEVTPQMVHFPQPSFKRVRVIPIPDISVGINGIAWEFAMRVRKILADRFINVTRQAVFL